jgi:hypothetical protein
MKLVMGLGLIKVAVLEGCLPSTPTLAMADSAWSVEF